MQKYNLNEIQLIDTWNDKWQSIKGLLVGEWGKLFTSIFAVLINSASSIATPLLVSIALDQYIAKNNLGGLNAILFGLVAMFIVTATVSYLQTRLVGQLSQRVLYRLRRNLFTKLQDLPVGFFQQNKAGDIIARVNSDTDKLNNFLSGSIFQFVSSFFTFIGIGIFIFFLNWQLAAVTWVAVFLVVIVSQLISGKVNNQNKISLRANGEMTAFLDENINNFKALVAFNKGSYLQSSFGKLNEDNFKKATLAQILNGFFNPLYSFAGNIAQVLVLSFGLYLFAKGDLSIGLLIGFISYTQKFYEPLRTLGNIWGNLQEALAAWGRIQILLKVK